MTIYKYDSLAKKFVLSMSFDYGKDYLPSNYLEDINKFMPFYDKDSRVRFTSDSTVIIGDKVFGVVTKGDSRFFCIFNGREAVSKKISQNDYEIDYPFFIVGNGDGVLISTIDYTGKEYELLEKGINLTPDISNVLLVSHISKN